MKIRGKFQLQAVKHTHWGDHKNLEFGAVYDQSIPDDQKYSDATPSASAQMLVKPDVAEKFKLGEFYYVDFTPVQAHGDHPGRPIHQSEFDAASQK